MNLQRWPFVLLTKAKLITDPSYMARVFNTRPESFSLLQFSLLKQIIKSSFLLRLTATGKEFCKLGHAIEILYAKKLLEHSKEGLTLFDVEKIYRVGLVAKRDEVYAKASSNFVAGDVIGGERQLVGVECKARVTRLGLISER